MGIQKGGKGWQQKKTIVELKNGKKIFKSGMENCKIIMKSSDFNSKKQKKNRKIN